MKRIVLPSMIALGLTQAAPVASEKAKPAQEKRQAQQKTEATEFDLHEVYSKAQVVAKTGGNW